MTSARAGSTSRRAAFAAAFAVLAAALATLGAALAGAVDAKLLGKTDRTPDPACPEEPCRVEGSMTGFQQEADGKNGLFRAREDGRVVAWAIDLSKPTANQRESFGNLFRNDTFGTDPTAGVAVLSPRGNGRYRLKAQSPIMTLDGMLGERWTFTLNDPLPIKDGHILALTVPTWAPMFGYPVSSAENRWKASREPGKCTDRDDILGGSPHRQIDTVRKYGCRYEGARLLYWGWFVPSA